MTAATGIVNNPTTEAAHTAEGIDKTEPRRRAGGLLSIIGAVAMATGGVVWSAAGADLWGLVDGDVAADTFLADAATSASTLTAAHIIWLAGVFVIALGGVLLAGPRTSEAALAARATYTIGAAVAIPSFVTMIALTRLAETGADAPALTEALAFIGVRLDDLATAAIVGLGPVLVALANRRTWVPRWLAAWAVACGALGLLSIFSIPFGQAAAFGFVVVPVGIVWTIAAGVVSLRQPAARA